MEQRKRNFIIFLTLFCIITGVAGFLFWPFIRELRNPVYREQFGLWMAKLGWKGVCITLGIQILQVVVAILPGGPVELLAGAAYGAIGGLAICLAGSVIASSLIFVTVRKFGAPLVEKVFRSAQSGRFAFLYNAQKTALVVFILFLIPGTPKDALTYLAPLGRISLGRFLIVSSIARIPALLSSTILGQSAMRGNWMLVLPLTVCIAGAGLAGILFSDRIITKLKSGARHDS